MPPFTFSRVLILADVILAAVIAALLLLTDVQFDVLTAIGWVVVILVIYLASILVP